MKKYNQEAGTLKTESPSPVCVVIISQYALSRQTAEAKKPNGAKPRFLILIAFLPALSLKFVGDNIIPRSVQAFNYTVAW